MKINHGLIRKINTLTGEVVNLYTYSELLFFSELRIRLFEEIAHQSDLQLFCSCSPDNDRPLMFSRSQNLCFPPDIPHSKSCVEMLSNMSCFIQKPLYKLLFKKGAPIPINVKWSKGCRFYYGVIKVLALNTFHSGAVRISFDDFIKIINYITFYKRALTVMRGISNYPSIQEFNCDLYFEFGKFTLSDSSGHLFHLCAQNMFHPSANLDTEYFLYANVYSIDTSYSAEIYINVSYPLGNTTVSISREKWDSIKDQVNLALPLCLCGFVRPSLHKSFSKGRRDSITHIYQKGSSHIYTKNILLSFFLFHVNNYGLICTNKEDYNSSNLACEKKDFYYVPFWMQNI